MRSLLKSFHYAFRGIGYQIACGRNFRIHCFAAVTVLYFSRFYHFGPWEWALLVLQITLVLAAESFNTAIEQTDNEVTDRMSRKIRHAKDTAAAGVLLFAISAVFSAYLLFWNVAVFRAIATYFSVSYRAALLALYFLVMLALIFCKKTYKKDC